MQNIRWITLIRHGETIWNKQNLLQGEKDIPLSDRGIKQAHEMANYFKNTSFHFVGASPLQRTQQTASIIAQELGVPLRTLTSLRPRSYGPWEGKKIEEIREQNKALFLLLSRCSKEEVFLNAPLESIESYHTVSQRVLPAISQIQHDALLITHSGVITSLCLALKLDTLHIPLLEQTGYVKLKISDKEVTIEEVKGLIMSKELKNEAREPVFIF